MYVMLRLSVTFYSCMPYNCKKCRMGIQCFWISSLRCYRISTPMQGKFKIHWRGLKWAPCSTLQPCAQWPGSSSGVHCSSWLQIWVSTTTFRCSSLWISFEQHDSWNKLSAPASDKVVRIYGEHVQLIEVLNLVIGVVTTKLPSLLSWEGHETILHFNHLQLLV